jgi:hypothetical protein
MEPVISESAGMERSLGRVEGKLDLALTAISALGASFDALEKGRLSRLEVQFATMETTLRVEAKSTATRNAVLWSLVTSSVSGIAILLVVHFLG